VLTRFRALYLRYAAAHADRLGGMTLPLGRRRPLVHLETIRLHGGMITFTGWAAVKRIAVIWPDGAVRSAPSIERADVVARHGLPLVTGFRLSVPDTARPLRLVATTASGRVMAADLRHPNDPPSRAAERRLMRAFAADLVRALPVGLWWLITRRPEARARLRRALGLGEALRARTLDPVYATPPRRFRARHPITIIVPVHNARDLTRDCLDRVAAHTDLPWHLVVIDDASTDPGMSGFLRGWAAHRPGQVTLLENPQNLGFVGSVNRGLALAEGRPGHVVVLNSDALVPPGWASRLLAPIEADASIASVTPMSNDAEIFSVPRICEAGALAPGQAEAMDRVAAGLGQPARLPSAPTGVGFCMAMSARWLAREPRLDAAFGRGYGEEVDWCQKLRRKGARHVCLPTLFVEHRGGQSFGAAQKRRLVGQANAMIRSRYPAYDVEVQSYIAHDPLATPRLALAIAKSAEEAAGPMPVFVAHSLGGGAEQALVREIEQSLARNTDALVLRVGGDRRWTLELHGRGGAVAGAGDDPEIIRHLMAPCAALDIVYSCGVGDPDPLGLPDMILSLIRPDRPDRVEMRVHDFFMVSPSYCLLGADGRYRGVGGAMAHDPAHRLEMADGRVVSLADWQAAWGRLVAACWRIVVFSEASRAIIARTYPAAACRIAVLPHRPVLPGPVASPAPDAPQVIGVLGNINHQKGAEIVLGLAERRSALGAPGAASARLVVVGNLDARYAPPRALTLHGSYDRAEIGLLVQRYGITMWLMPSIWPETFSFVTHEMLATGLPVLGFDIGGQGEALRAAPNGWPVPFDPDADPVEAMRRAIAERARPGRSAPPVGLQPATVP
jgi:GT2 family glycosyltransferase/glycosyltransferase involved in cell wall biosynthesis